MVKPKILFLCYHNSARSQMAEGLLKKLAGEKFDVYSAGIKPSVVHPMAIQVMNEIGIDISEQKSKSVTDFLKDHFEYVITVCDSTRDKCPIFTGAAVRLHWPFEDPASASVSKEEKLNTFRKIRDQIKQKIIAWLEELKKEE